MKKIFISFAFLLLVVSSFAQRSDEKELKSLMKDLGYSWIETKFATLDEGESAYYWRTFYSGNDYAIIAFSEKSEVKDIDIYLYDEEGALAGQSESSEDFEIIEHTPADSKQMKVVIKNYDCEPASDRYKCKFMVFYK